MFYNGANHPRTKKHQDLTPLEKALHHYKYHKICIICGNQFDTDIEIKKTCGDDCAKKNHLQNVKRNKELKELLKKVK